MYHGARAYTKTNLRNWLVLWPLGAGLSLLQISCNDPAEGIVAGSRWTDWTPFHNPPLGLENIDVKCCLTLLANGALIEECRFRNNDGNTKRFLYCDMIDLVSGKRGPRNDPDALPRCNVILERDTLKCVERSINRGSVSSFHFGCKLVTLPGNSTRHILFVGNGTYKPHLGLPFKVRPWDFEVSYADVWNLTGTSISFDSASCEKVTGQGGWLVPDHPPEVAYWIVRHEPFDDPYVQYQSTDPEISAGPVQYVLLDEVPCAPEGFPEITNTAFPRCPKHDGDAPAVSVDLNLFWWESMLVDEPRGQGFPVVMRLETEGDLEGIRVVVQPEDGERFVIRAGAEEFGQLALCNDKILDQCVAPNVEEGRRVTVVAKFFDAETNEFLFAETVTFTKDTVPPEVAESTVEIESNLLNIEIDAVDRTTSPIFANVWYSLDGGESWLQESMSAVETDEEVLEDLPERTFTASIDIGQAQRVEYYIGVQDLVYNTVYWGIGSITRS